MTTEECFEKLLKNLSLRDKVKMPNIVVEAHFMKAIVEELLAGREYFKCSDPASLTLNNYGNAQMTTDKVLEGENGT